MPPISCLQILAFSRNTNRAADCDIPLATIATKLHRAVRGRFGATRPERSESFRLHTRRRRSCTGGNLAVVKRGRGYVTRAGLILDYDRSGWFGVDRKGSRRRTGAE